MKRGIIATVVALGVVVAAYVRAGAQDTDNRWWLATGDDGTLYLVTQNGYYEVTPGTMPPDLLANLPDLGPTGPNGPNGEGFGPPTSPVAEAPAAAQPQPSPEPPTPTPGPSSLAPKGETHSTRNTLSSVGQQDRYTISATQGQILEVHVKRTSGLTLIPSIAIIDPTGNREDRNYDCNDGKAATTTRLASSGTYTIIIGSTPGLNCNGTGPYEVTWSLGRTGRLYSGSPAQASIDYVDQQDRYTIEGRQGQHLAVLVRRTSGLTFIPYITIIDPEGNREALSYDCNGGEAQTSATLASSGTYRVIIGTTTGLNCKGVGPYEVMARLQ